MAFFGSAGASKGEDLDSVFCSELCAAVLKHAVVLDEREDSNAYSPADFSSDNNAAAKKHLLSGWSYDLECCLDLTAAPAIMRKPSVVNFDTGGTVRAPLTRTKSKVDSLIANSVNACDHLHAKDKEMDKLKKAGKITAYHKSRDKHSAKNPRMQRVLSQQLGFTPSRSREEFSPKSPPSGLWQMNSTQSNSAQKGTTDLFSEATVVTEASTKAATEAEAKQDTADREVDQLSEGVRQRASSLLQEVEQSEKTSS